MSETSDPPFPPAHRVLVPLFAIQFFAWSGMFILWVNAFPLISRFVMHLTQTDEAAMRQGLIVVSLCFSLYATGAGFLAFALPALVSRWGEGLVLAAALAVGAAGLASLGVIDRPIWLVPAFAAIGVAWCALGNLPYAIAGSAVHWTRISHILRIFSFSSIIPQVAVSLGLALFGATFFGQAVQQIMLVGGGSMAIAAVLATGFYKRISIRVPDRASP